MIRAEIRNWCKFQFIFPEVVDVRSYAPPYKQINNDIGKLDPVESG